MWRLPGSNAIWENKIKVMYAKKLPPLIPLGLSVCNELLPRASWGKHIERIEKLKMLGGIGLWLVGKY